MTFRIRRDSRGKMSEYNITIKKVKYKFNPFIRLELDGNVIRLVNAFSGVNHLFEDGSKELILDEKELRLLMKKIENDFRVVG